MAKLNDCNKFDPKKNDYYTKKEMWENIKHLRKLKVLNLNQWKTQRKHRFCVRTYGKLKENIGFVIEFIENKKENTCCAWEPIENARDTHGLRGNI